MEIHLIVLDVVVCLAFGVRESLFHHQVMSDDIDIQYPRYHMRRWAFFEPICGFAGAWTASRARNASPWEHAIVNLQSTCYGRRPGPHLSRRVPAGSQRATEPRVRENTRGRKTKTCRCDKKRLYTYQYLSNITIAQRRRALITFFFGISPKHCRCCNKQQTPHGQHYTSSMMPCAAAPKPQEWRYTCHNGERTFPRFFLRGSCKR